MKQLFMFYHTLDFLPFKEYVSMLEEHNYKLVGGDYDYVLYENDEEQIKIVKLKDNEKEWISFYRYKLGMSKPFEVVSFMLYKTNKRVVINSSYKIIDNNVRLMTSGYTYEEDNLIDGWKEEITIEKDDLNHIYTPGENLSNLVNNARKNCIKTSDYISQKDIKTLELKY